jgi:hypothetical protein
MEHGFGLRTSQVPRVISPLCRQALDKLELPFIVKVGMIEKISLKTPSYSSLLRMTGEPVVVRITGVYLLVDKSVQTPEEVNDCWKPIVTSLSSLDGCNCCAACQIVRAQESVKRSALNLAALWRARQAAQANGDTESSTKQAGWMDKVVSTILDNLKVTVVIVM